MNTLALHQPVCYIILSGISPNDEPETLLIPVDQLPKVKEQIVKHTFVDLGDRMIPRKRIEDIIVGEIQDNLQLFELTLSSDMKRKYDERKKQMKDKTGRIVKTLAEAKAIVDQLAQ